MTATKTHGVKSRPPQNPPRPTFIGIGGHKCASTWLAECLYCHPEILMTSPKEIQFFDMNAGKGMGWYLKYFRNGNKYKAAGEFTPRYLVNVPPTEIRDALGNLQVIVSLRNPASRFVSHYRHYIRRGLLSKRDFQTLNMDTLHAAVSMCPDLVQEGMYSAPLKSYLDAFGVGNVHIIIKDDIDADPSRHNVLKELYGFLGVDDTYVPPIVSTIVNKGYVHKHGSIEALWRPVRRCLRRYAPRSINHLSRSPLGRLYRKINVAKDGLTVGEGVQGYLRDLFSKDVDRLEELIGRELPSWKKTGESSP